MSETAAVPDTVTLTEKGRVALATLVSKGNGRPPEHLVELALEIMVAHDLPMPPYEGSRS